MMDTSEKYIEMCHVVRLIEPVQLPQDKVAWLMEGYRARKIN